MTTIAYDGRTLAADGLWSAGWGVVLSRSAQKIRVVDRKIYALTGVAGAVDACIQWHRSGAEPGKAPKASGDGWTLIVVDDGGLVVYTDGVPHRSPIYPPPAAFGAGCEVALTAMLCGKSAREAIELTAKICTHTGGEIMVVDIATALAGGITSTIGHVPLAAE